MSKPADCNDYTYTPPSGGEIDGDDMCVNAQRIVLAVGLETVTISRRDYDAMVAELERVSKIQRMA